VSSTLSESLSRKLPQAWRVKLIPRVEGEIVSGLKYLQVVKRAGMTVDKTEAMLGSYGPQQEEYTKIVSHIPAIFDPSPRPTLSPSPPAWSGLLDDPPPWIGFRADPQFASEESPSGMLARSGSYAVKSRLIDDDKQVWLDFEWGEL